MARREIRAFASGLDEAMISRVCHLGITGITQANPAVVTVGVNPETTNGFVNGDLAVIRAVVGMTQVNLRLFTIGTVTATTVQLTGEDSTAHGAYVSGGTITKLSEVTSGEQNIRLIYDDGGPYVAPGSRDRMVTAARRALERMIRELG